MGLSLCNIRRIIAAFLIFCWFFLGLEGFKNKCVKEHFLSENDEPSVNLFWAKWCPHCTKLKAKEKTDSPMAWDNFQTEKYVSTSKGNVLIRNYEIDEAPQIAKEFNVKGFPTVVLVNQKGEKIVQTSGKRDREGWISFVRQNI
tara:strand:- start:1548 stop:1979 length:432 start_codon:yes stop_codon:yes gene_type:complete